MQKNGQQICSMLSINRSSIYYDYEHISRGRSNTESVLLFYLQTLREAHTTMVYSGIHLYIICALFFSFTGDIHVLARVKNHCITITMLGQDKKERGYTFCQTITLRYGWKATDKNFFQASISESNIILGNTLQSLFKQLANVAAKKIQRCVANFFEFKACRSFCSLLLYLLLKQHSKILQRGFKL